MKFKVEEYTLLFEYLCKKLDMPKKRITQYLKHGSIYVNNNKVTKYNFELEKGMIVAIDFKNKNNTLPFDILYEDDYIIAVDKPSGLLTISTDKEKEKTLYHMVREYLRTKNKLAKVYIIHRLDKDTSGIVVLAKDEKSKNIFQEKWNEIVSVREYTAIVEGTLKKKEDRLVHKLEENKAHFVYVSKEGKEAITSYQVIKEKNDYSKLRIFIETGRKNQIRVQLSSIGHPVLGDKKYNKSAKEKRLYLHASRLKVFHPISRKIITITSKVPGEFDGKVK